MEKYFYSAAYMCPGLIYSYGPVVRINQCITITIRLVGIRYLLGLLEVRGHLIGRYFYDFDRVYRYYPYT